MRQEIAQMQKTVPPLLVGSVATRKALTASASCPCSVKSSVGSPMTSTLIGISRAGACFSFHFALKNGASNKNVVRVDKDSQKYITKKEVYKNSTCTRKPWKISLLNFLNVMYDADLL